MKLEDQLAQFAIRTRLQWSHHEMGKSGLHKVGRLTCPYDAFINLRDPTTHIALSLLFFLSSISLLSPVLLDLTYLQLNSTFFLSLSLSLSLSPSQPFTL
ncbi:hypothetical protein ACN38_g8246 [Penicillium nordicum]|uniref:Uncharacterized protein n=1 Tax=Penicillium nordicum TaxID=229535 RepID=A0A0M8P540_9EURO|nr:hypothetical protein ACN38_g8246 [Penicillium nordicum]